MAVLLQSTKGRELLKESMKGNFKEEWLLDDWALLVETLLQWEAYLKLAQMEKKHVKRLQKKHRYLMFLIKKVSARSKGMGLKIQKFHGILHIAEDIMMFGVPMVMDTGANESHHKLAKLAAKLTQRDIRVFEKQTSQRLMEFLLLDLALEELDGRTLWDYFVVEDEDAYPTEAVFVGDKPKSTTGGTQIQVYFNEDDVVQFKLPGSRMKNQEKVSWDTHVVEYLADVQEGVKTWIQSLEIRSEHKRDGVVFCGHPNYRGMGIFHVKSGASWTFDSFQWA